MSKMLRLKVLPTNESIREGLKHSSTREGRKDRQRCELSKCSLPDIARRSHRLYKDMSGLGQEQTFALQKVMSTLPQKRTFAVHEPNSAMGQERTSSATHDISGNQRQADDNDREPYDDKKNQGPEPVGLLKPLPRY